MANGWQADKLWADRFMPEVKGHLGRALFAEASIAEDQQQATDLILLRAGGFTAGCRIRKYQYVQEYGTQFTLRCARPHSGRDSELKKIVDGWCDYFFYGFADQSERRLCSWFILDFSRMRAAWIREPALLHGRPSIPNRDGSSEFMAWRLTEYPADVIVAAGGAE